MKKNFISFPESLEASKRSICCHDFIIFCKVCIDFSFSPSLAWKHDTSAVCGDEFEQNTLTVSISIFILMLTNILSIRNVQQVNTKEVNTQKIKAQLQLEATSGIAHQSEEQHCCVSVSSLRMKTESEQTNVCPPKFMLI